eukprot:CAMPEP_0201485914 /NCGR_PEP_ID=MMETSP0151_2-20130828/9996_1 /ASSEMBLY_ACC=CAM_ASM_000257 /TAXON_ID=200890 /ORGANISM="Paramoeba atlantica, Strain 621/1 / CCAP 1560/9" /LENGTH=847 /DNA_ID=CAMNT_0047870261 /DNA_START=62 /DNA_END=2605 /DNA_ORIENTATION=+
MTIVSVIKRNHSTQHLERTKLLTRVALLTSDLDTRYLDTPSLVDAVLAGTYPNISTEALDELLAQTAASRSTQHPDYGKLAGRLALTALYKTTPDTFLEAMTVLYNYTNPVTGEPSPIISPFIYNLAKQNEALLQNALLPSNDLNYEYFGYKTLERSYLLRVEKQGKRIVVERPQYMLMRVALGIHGEDMEGVVKAYGLLSQGWFTHATPTLFNAGTPAPQMSSCFLLSTVSDSIAGIYDTLRRCAVISKSAGGIGLHVHEIRAAGSYIKGTNGTSNGLVPMLRVFNDTARYVDQGGGKRKGAFAIYLEPWHADIFDFLSLKRNTGKEEMRARDLFYGLWIPDLFMKRVQEKGTWTLFDPNTAPGLPETYGEEFEKLYEKYEQEGVGVRTVQAQELWFTIVESQIETGTPYMLYKDACNRKSNQKNLGTIQCSNLCTEIVEYTSPEEVAVCNLASIALPMYVREQEPAQGESTKDATPLPYFDFEKLRNDAAFVTISLNRIIDRNHYPVQEARRSNLRHRPIGIGVQGLADAFLRLRLPFASAEAQKLNDEIFETIYFGAAEASCELAKQFGPYETFPGSPMSQGQFQFDLWGEKPPSGRWDWDALRVRIQQHGMRNSLLLAPMPTASTSQILGNNECFEPFTSNLYVRRVLSGEFPVVNKYLVRDLIRLGIWNEDTRNAIIAANGSVQTLPSLPQEYKELYRTVWEIKQKDILDMAVARGKYICQSQSLNLFLETPSSAQITSMHFYGWKKGLKTGMYYLRSRPAVDAIKFTVDTARLEGKGSVEKKKVAATTSPSKVGSKRTQQEREGGERSDIRSPLRPGPPTVDDAARSAADEEEGECLACGS